MLKEIELMEFTGKRDMYRTEIYEGDIVRGICSTNPAYVCEGLIISGMMGQEVSGVVEYSEFYARFFVTTDGITYLDLENGITQIKVVGNKYE